MGRESFERLMHVVRDKLPDELAWRQVHYWVFDLPSAAGGFSQRQRQMQALAEQTDARYLRWVKQRRFTDQQSLQRQLKLLVAAGGEGLMLQQDNLPYRAGRHAGLLKLKTFVDAEARVVSYVPGKGKYQGLVGALLVEDPEGRRFRLGSGLSDVQRHAPPLLGSRVSYRFQGRTSKGLPRFARFLRIRVDE